MKFSLNKLNELSGGDKEFNASIIRTFLEETPEDIKKLEKAITSKEFEQIYQVAHKIKPNADVLGIDDVREHMLTIERHARRDKDIGAIKKIYLEAETVLNNAFKEFKNYLGQ